MAPEKGPRPEPDKEKIESPETEEKVSLRDFLTYENPNLPRYQRLIEEELKSGGTTFPQQFSEGWVDIYFNSSPNARGEEKYNPQGEQQKELRRLFGEKLQGEILIDVGGGQAEFMQELAKKSGVKRYINVDYWNRESDQPLDPYVGRPAQSDYPRLPENERVRPMEAILVGADMLDFVARLPNNSCNFVINGIDQYTASNNDYRKALMEELIRTTKVGGIVFGMGSDIWLRDDPRLKDVGKKLGLDVGSYTSEAIFEKVKE